MRASMHIASSKNLCDPNYTMSSVPNTPPTLPPDAPPLAPLVTNTYESGNVKLVTLNSSGGLSDAHRFIIDATCINGHINSNN